MRGDFRGLSFIAGLLLGLYLLNSAFSWIVIPNSLEKITFIVDAIAGIVLILFGVTSLLRPPAMYNRGYY